MVEVIGDELFKIDSGKEGPAVFILGGTHGNEETGILLVKQLLEDFRTGTHELLRGKLFLGIGNPLAVALGTRGVDGRDLNRYFTPAHLVDRIDGSETEARAIALAEICDQSDMLIDIHSTNKPSIPFICCRVDAAHERVYRWFSYSTVLGDPHYVLAGEPATIDDYMNTHGKVGMCIETGQASDTTRLPDTLKSVRSILGDLGLLNSDGDPAPAAPEHVYILHTCVRRDERAFEFAEGRGLRSFEPIEKGDTFGFLGDEEIVSDVSGVIVFPKLREHQGPGLPVGYIAERKGTLG